MCPGELAVRGQCEMCTSVCLRAVALMSMSHRRHKTPCVSLSLLAAAAAAARCVSSALSLYAYFDTYSAYKKHRSLELTPIRGGRIHTKLDLLIFSARHHTKILMKMRLDKNMMRHVRI